MTKGVFQAIRAIGAEFAQRLWTPIFYITLIAAILCISLLVWLTSMSAWWWLLAIPIGIGVSVATTLLIVSRLLIRYVRPNRTPTQKKQVRQFVDKLALLQELSGTPKFIILFRTIRSLAAPRSESYLKDLVSTKNLKNDFSAIARSFEE